MAIMGVGWKVVQRDTETNFNLPSSSQNNGPLVKATQKMFIGPSHTCLPFP